MRVSLILKALAFGVTAAAAMAQAPLGTEWTYQGKLDLLGSPLNGTADFAFALYDDPTLGLQVGSTVTLSNVAIVDGLFTVELDFGNVFGDTALYLEVAVRSPHDPSDSAPLTTLAPRQPVTPAPVALALRHLRTEATVAGPNVIGGDGSNTIASGLHTSIIAGGAGNSIDNNGFEATICGGANNLASGQQAVVVGGTFNGASGFRAFIGGGHSNSAQVQEATIGGGLNNDVLGVNGTIGGGKNNSVGLNTAGASITGGDGNTTLDSYSVVCGGRNNTAGSDDGDPDNATHATVSGGEGNLAAGPHAIIAGGLSNTASGVETVVSGGKLNDALGFRGVIGGGALNRAAGERSTVGGGEVNHANAQASTVGGGYGNFAQADFATISGGGTSTLFDFNTSQYAYDTYGTIGGGGFNRVGSADGDPNNASYGTIGGGFSNRATGTGSTVPGGAENRAGGDYSFAAGQRAKVRDGGPGSPYYSGDSDGDEGTFAWADSTPADFISTGPNQFLIRASGGVGINENNPSATLDVVTTQPGRVLDVVRAADSVQGANLLTLESGAGSDDASQLIEAKRGSDIEFRVDGDGDVLADGTYNGPADFAEMIKVSGGAETVEAGDVLVIDARNPRAVVKSHQARSTLVAGVYSTNPGYLGAEHDWDEVARELGHATSDGKPVELGLLLDEVPLAVVGIVPCKVTAENGPIKPGDLLVTSMRPGHAMRDDAPGVGTVIGKALGSLDSGTGVIRVLVTLQ